MPESNRRTWFMRPGRNLLLSNPRQNILARPVGYLTLIPPTRPLAAIRCAHPPFTVNYSALRPDFPYLANLGAAKATDPI